MGRGDDLVCARARDRADRGHCRRPAEIARLKSLEDKLLEAKDSYWANQVEVQRLGAAGILAHTQGDDKKAVELTRAAADLEATMDKHPATPASVFPARELLADLLLELGEPAAALKEYDEALRAEPNRFRSILGKARAAKRSGDVVASRDAYEKLAALSTSAASEHQTRKPRPSRPTDIGGATARPTQRGCGDARLIEPPTSPPNPAGTLYLTHRLALARHRSATRR